MDALKPEDPARIGPFIPLARIGAGGMGRVYLARSRGGRPVAVKVIRAEYAEDERFRTRFRREVQAARSVDGLYTASVLDAGPDDDEPWLATTYIPGPSLQRVVHDHGPLPERSARVLGAGIAEALGAIHTAGLIHRDLKPSNVICGPDGPRVIDFGISYAVGGSSLTTTGIVVGSARYASPEQCRADPELQAASDVFALGGVLVYATTGVPPFGDGPDHVQLYLVVHEKPDLTGVPIALRPIVSACLEKDPANRPTTEDLLDTLLPPDDAGAAGDADWLPAAVHQDMRKYSAGVGVLAGGAAAAGSAGSGSAGPAGSAGSVAEDPGTPTHERPGQDPAGTPAPGDPDATDAGQSRGSITGVATGLGTTAVPGVSSAEQAGNPSRRRILAGVVGAAAVAASGGGAWYAATRNTGKKSATQNAGASAPIGTPSKSTASPSQSPSTPDSATTSSSPSASPTPTPSHSLGQWAEDWSAKYNLGGASGGALVCGSKLISVYTAGTNDPNPPQSLIALNTTTGQAAFPPKIVPGVDAPSGVSIAADANYVYTYTAGVVYAWNLGDGSAAWNAKTGLSASTPNNGMPLVGIQGLINGMLIIGPTGFDPSYPICIAGFDITKRATVWTMKTTDLLTPLPTGLAAADTTPSLSVPKAGNLFYVALADHVSVRVLKGVDPKTGKDAWNFPFKGYTDNGAVVNTPTVTGTAQHVYLTDMHSGSVQAYDAATGHWKWSYPTGEGAATQTSNQRFTGPVVESGDTVYATDATSVMALQISTTSKTGAALWPKPTQYNGISGAPAVVGDKIWVEVQIPTGANPLALAVLDNSDGQQVHQYPMPEGPSGDSADLLVADPTKPAVYVLTASGQVLGYDRSQ
ncbi:protein kinase [Catenulispora sp. NF23]|uniref:protein kinase domain-containing protein n=1 Tax=Catenulispora pinistramenti TaxID=2705254 RepID=UPI001BA73C23|nr:protein kinase [Catenulispora pinistramenti]MBS2537204.1 protein kinase [Catenulispora pinistramenti]